ncbi:FMR1-interacting protein NUFIP1-like [Physella acuta]|uniref:FMR1-interacting protein NUFIP1-like n=1 Tax=Physella acuta TaxID=109671 RepID=UPI0027DC8004|nr:FMR1-interacting protein NUFIP1-like [Physella acuta]XP_059172995.1 FMR1-interacting protein NUFIP1-like [Physella acuta]XP_059172996.1 FMR1-interacting protein NUFIP1-like [Physella acuta]XP_059172997.1 FMR1-interacting protein NUFIP1-like [Physella acuta]
MAFQHPPPDFSRPPPPVYNFQRLPSPHFSNNYYQSSNPQLMNQNRCTSSHQYNAWNPYQQKPIPINSNLVSSGVFTGPDIFSLPPRQAFPYVGHSQSSDNSGQGRHQTGYSNKFTKKKEKIDKRLLPENNVFFCDICDRGFKSEEKYKEHTAGHIKCKYQDCPFIAAPKLVQLHMSMQHRSGLAKKVWSLESEEDVKKWRDERKRNFPTAENIKKKYEERSERMARGEIIFDKSFRKQNGDRGNRGRGRGHRGRGSNRRKNDWSNDKFDPVPDIDGKNSDSDNEPPEEMAIQKSQAIENSISCESNGHDQVSPAGGLALLASYGDSSSEDENSNKELSAGTTPEARMEISLIKANGLQTDGTQQENEKSSSIKPSSHIQLSDINTSKRVAHSPKAGKKHPLESPITVTSLKKRKWLNRHHNYTLLEKLLAPEIRRERNKILQCVYFIVQQKFFEPSQPAQ